MKILILLVFATITVNANIFNFKYFSDYFNDRKLENKAVEKMKQFHDILVKFFESESRKVKMIKKQEPNTETFKIVFQGGSNEDESCFVEGKIYQDRENTIEINLVNSIDSSNLTYSNIDLTDETEIKVINEKYLTPYFNHLDEILYDKQQKNDQITTSIKKALEAKYDITVEAVENNKQPDVDAFLISLLQKGKDSEKDIASKFDILVEVNDNNEVHFKTNFFESDFSLSISTATYIDHQIQKLANSIESHFDKLRRFSNNDDQTVIECDKILESFDIAKKNQIYEFIKTESKDNEFTGSITFKMGNQVYPPSDTEVHIEYKCQEFGGSSEDLALVLEVSLGDGIDPIKQIFFKESLYDLNPVAESFWEEIFDLLVKFYAPETLDSVMIFKDSPIVYQGQNENQPVQIDDEKDAKITKTQKSDKKSASVQEGKKTESLEADKKSNTDNTSVIKQTGQENESVHEDLPEGKKGSLDEEGKKGSLDEEGKKASLDEEGKKANETKKPQDKSGSKQDKESVENDKIETQKSKEKKNPSDTKNLTEAVKGENNTKADGKAPKSKEQKSGDQKDETLEQSNNNAIRKLNNVLSLKKTKKSKKILI